MTRTISLSLLVASVALAATASAQQRPLQQENYVEFGREFRQADRVTMGADLLTQEEEQRFAELRRRAKSREDLDRIEAEERTLLNQRVAERIAAALNQPAESGAQRVPNTAERPATDRMPAQQSPYDPGASEGSMGR